MQRSPGSLLAWIFALALMLVLTGLFVATSESLRHQEHGIPYMRPVEPDVPPAPSNGESTYHGPNAAGWRAP